MLPSWTVADAFFAAVDGSRGFAPDFGCGGYWVGFVPGRVRPVILTGLCLHAVPIVDQAVFRVWCRCL